MKAHNRYNPIKSLVFIMFLMIASTGCSSLALRPWGMANGGTDSDQEAEEYDKQAAADIKEEEEKAKKHGEEADKKSLEEKVLKLVNDQLGEYVAEDREAIEQVMQEIRDNAQHDRDMVRPGRPICTIMVDCEKCHRQNEMTFGKFMELAERYGTGYRYRTRIEYFLWWETSRHKYGFKFKTCHSCMKEQHMKRYIDSMEKNKQAMARLIIEAGLERSQQARSQQIAKKYTKARETVGRQSARRQHHRQRAEDAEKALEEERKKVEEERRRDRLEMATRLMASGMSREDVMGLVPGLTEEDFRAH
ncbi:MAG: hypothetical protein ROO73_04780 [Roseivirga sp.]